LRLPGTPLYHGHIGVGLGVDEDLHLLPVRPHARHRPIQDPEPPDVGPGDDKDPPGIQMGNGLPEGA